VTRWTWTRRSLGLLGAAAAALVVSACDKAHPQTTLNPQGPVAQKMQNLFNPVFWIAVFVFVLVEGLIIFTAVKYRRRSDDERPVQVHGNTRLEVTWTILPALTLAVVGFFTVKTIFEISHVPKNAMQINVTGHRWWWEYDYPQYGIKTGTELHIPAGVPVVLNLTSADVIHNFWPPALVGKLYAIPGRHNQLWFSANHPGTYYGQCAEYCGISHANMRLRVIAQTQSDFNAWVKGQQAPPPAPAASTDAASGLALFQARGCAGCHTINGISAGSVGPNLTHLQSRSTFAGGIFNMTPNNLRKWLRNPPAAKPGSVMPNLNLSEEDITKLLAYLETLK
jgi:cytochrome c oxidase subunit 2